MKGDIIELTKSFDPKLNFTQADKQLRPYGLIELKSDELYAKAEQLTALAAPSFEDKWETRWRFFYMPMKHEGKLICSPIALTLYKAAYGISFYGYSRGMGYVSIDKGNDKVLDLYHQVIDETSRFIPLIKEKGNQLIEQTFPYQWRQGKVRRKYVRGSSELISLDEKEKINSAYRKHQEKKLTVTEISLNDYLNTAALCIRAAFPKDITPEMTTRDIARRRADMRHGGMLFLENPDNKKEFMEWFLSEKWSGAHPFEIVYSTPHGIILYPPDKDCSAYRLSVYDPFYNNEFVKMASALIDHEIPFNAPGLEEALEYVAGEGFVGVNTMHEDAFRYDASPEHQEKYFPYIQWDEIEVLQWK
jgi:hypothetical protein